MQHIPYPDTPPITVSPDAGKGALVIAWAAGNLGIDPKELLALLAAIDINETVLLVKWKKPPGRTQKAALRMAWSFWFEGGDVIHISATSGRTFKS